MNKSFCLSLRLFMPLALLACASCTGSSPAAPTGTAGTGASGGTGGVDGGPSQSDVRPPDEPVSLGDRYPTPDAHVSTVVIVVSPATSSLQPGQTQSFTAMVTGATNTGVTWGATGGTITTDGTFTAPTNGGGYVVRATSVEDPSASGTAIVNVTGGGSVLEPFFDANHPYVQVMTPMPYATYFAPATIRVWAHAPDNGNDSVAGGSPQVDFYLGTTKFGSVKPSANGPDDLYQADATGIPAGTYELYVKSLLGSGTIDSMHIPITVVDVGPHGGTNMTLTSDLVLSGSTNLDIIGTATSRALVTSSNGSRIRSSADWNGHLTIRYADVIGLGSMDTAGIEVSVNGSNALEISNSVIDRCGPPKLTANGQAPVTIIGNTFQPNILTTVDDRADYAGSNPSVYFTGSSTAAKTFQGNNIGVSYVQFDKSTKWMIGGANDADSNVVIGVRAGFELDGATGSTVRGNFSFHRYPFGWSQGMNLNFMGGGPYLVERNIFRGGSWMVQSMAGEFRYNLLVDNINHAFFRDALGGTLIHHNVLINVGYQRLYEPSGGLETSQGSFYNNTVDAGGTQLGWFNASFFTGGPVVSARNNVFTGFAYQNATDLFDAGSATGADYNLFYNPDTTKLTPYADSGLGAHDLAASSNPKFAQARVVPFPIGDGDVWLRRVTVSQMLSLYRGIYTPLAGSPLIDAGSPSDDTGGKRNTDIGAVGAGNPHPDDLFGL